jgi:hypothetical protein
MEDSQETQFGYIDGIKYNIEDIILKKLDYTNIYDINDNKLIVCDGDIRSPYLRRYSETNDNKMSEWHKNWQKHFVEYTEITYKKINDKQIKNRRCDVDLNEKKIIEFQHSNISYREVNERLHDWNLNNKQIIWVIDGNNTIDITFVKLDRQFLEFTNNLWKYENFKSYDIIYIDINEYIYKINPKNVKSRMIEVEKPITKLEFINCLKNNIELPYLKQKIYQTNIYVKQQGAGNGKTYGIIQLLGDIDYKHYDTFIYLTKQHSAKEVIRSEFRDQQEKNLLENINIIDEEDKNKKYIYNYINDNKECKMIIGTIDSFIYSLADKSISGVDKFKRMALSIIEEEIKTTKNGYIKYAGNDIVLNKRMIIICDEMQDVHENYMKALIKISRETYTDLYIVGDKLQSISIENNAFTFLENELPTDIINYHRYEPSNICRRFISKDSIDFINNIIPFEDYGLKSIEPYTEFSEDNSLNFILGKCIFANEKDEKRIIKEVDTIMKEYIYEVETYNRKPNDFLIVTPFVKKNPLVEYLHMAIRNYWELKTMNKEYSKYSIFHKSEEGTSIDLKESEDATRIVSIHSSKGDGRDVVFVIGLSDSSLKRFSVETGNLLYNSLLHVALTRMKQKLYIRYEDNGDNIHRLFSKYINTNTECIIKPYLKIKNKIKIGDILEYNNEDYFDTCNKNIMKKIKYNKLYEEEENCIEKPKLLIDLEHHCIRYACSYITLSLQILKNKQTIINKVEQPLYQILKKILKIYKFQTFNTIKEYYSHLSIRKEKFEKKQIIPLLKFEEKYGDYEKYYNILLTNIDDIKNIIDFNNFEDIEINKLSPLNIIILYHLITISEHKINSDLPITSLYDIIDIFEKLNKNDKEIYENMFYEDINDISEIYKKFSSMDMNKNLKYVVNHHIEYNGNNKNIMLYNNIPFIGFNEKNIILCNLYPQFNSINYNEILYQGLFDTYIIKNIKKDSENYERFVNKKIFTCIFTYDNNKNPYYIKYHKNGIDYIDNNNMIIKNIIKENLKIKFKTYNRDIYQFCKYYIENNKDKTSEEIIQIIQNEYDNIECKDFPKYISKFLNKFEDEDILDCLDYNYLNKKLNKIIDRFIDYYI